jgi:branched-chain amino acid transport system ATP-binding protein
MPVLEVRQLSMDFGGLRALDRVDLHVNAGEIVALIGPNGAGKTTFFNCVTGLYQPAAGSILITPAGKKTESLRNLKPNRVTEKGLARTFQNIRLFPNMTVLENVMIGRHCRMASGIAGAIFRNRRTVQEEKRAVEKSYEIVVKMGLAGHVNEVAASLSYGAQRRLEIARALATEPFILLLDEPAAGMNPLETKELDALIVKIREEEGIAILLIEHDMSLVMSLSDRIVVLDYGRKIAQGIPEHIRQDPVVIRAYLGEETDA